MGDDDDRKYLDNLDELEREKILGQRHQEREKRKRQQEILKEQKNKNVLLEKEKKRREFMDELAASKKSGHLTRNYSESDQESGEVEDGELDKD